LVIPLKIKVKKLVGIAQQLPGNFGIMNGVQIWEIMPRGSKPVKARS